MLKALAMVAVVVVAMMFVPCGVIITDRDKATGTAAVRSSLDGGTIL